MSHLSDPQLLLDLEGQAVEIDVRKHLAECGPCRERREELEQALNAFVRIHGQPLSTADGPRALLRERMAQITPSPWAWQLGWPAALGLLALGLFMIRALLPGHSPSAAVLSIPDARLTPGATLLASRPAVCAQANTRNKTVPPALRRAVFEEYGIANADPRAYEVDYLVTPALGGADDIRNLWPHSYASTAWNASVKDALEDRLREMVCAGSLDLSEAQHEIAGNWIEAYKRYFHTDEPLPEHRK